MSHSLRPAGPSEGPAPRDEALGNAVLGIWGLDWVSHTDLRH